MTSDEYEKLKILYNSIITNNNENIDRIKYAIDRLESFEKLEKMENYLSKNKTPAISFFSTIYRKKRKPLDKNIENDLLYLNSINGTGGKKTSSTINKVSTDLNKQFGKEIIAELKTARNTNNKSTMDIFKLTAQSGYGYKDKYLKYKKKYLMLQNK